MKYNENFVLLKTIMNMNMIFSNMILSKDMVKLANWLISSLCINVLYMIVHPDQLQNPKFAIKATAPVIKYM